MFMCHYSLSTIMSCKHHERSFSSKESSLCLKMYTRSSGWDSESRLELEKNVARISLRNTPDGHRYPYSEHRRYTSHDNRSCAHQRCLKFSSDKTTEFWEHKVDYAKQRPREYHVKLCSFCTVQDDCLNGKKAFWGCVGGAATRG